MALDFSDFIFMDNANNPTEDWSGNLLLVSLYDMV